MSGYAGRACDRNARAIYLSQEAFINSILTRFNLMDTTPLSTPMVPSTRLSVADCPTSQEKEVMAAQPYRELVGSLSWLALGTRPDIAFAATSLARFGNNLVGFTGTIGVERVVAPQEGAIQVSSVE